MVSEEHATFEELLETGKLLPIVPRAHVRKWGQFVDREAVARIGATRVSVIREHMISLDTKSGTLAAVAGVALAAYAVIGGYLLADQTRDTVDYVVLGLFVLGAISVVFATVYSLSALGVEQPEGGAIAGQGAFEYRMLQRMIYRARNHAYGLRSAQVAVVALFLIAAFYQSSAMNMIFDRFMGR